MWSEEIYAKKKVKKKVLQVYSLIAFTKAKEWNTTEEVKSKEGQHKILFHSAWGVPVTHMYEPETALWGSLL